MADRPTWRVTFARTENDMTVADFDCEISKLGRYVSPKVGELQIQIPIPNADVGKDASKIFDGAGMLSMYVYRNNEIWWGGFMDESEVDSAGDYPVVTVTGATFESYPERREVRTDENLNMEQTHYAKWAWDYMQRERGGNLMVDTPTPQASGRSREFKVLRSDIKTVGAVLKEVSNRADGFEWIIECFHDDAGTRQRRLTTGYPVIGRPSDGAILTFPGEVITYKITSAALDGAVSFQARGKAPDPVGSPGTPGNTDGTGGSGKPAEKQPPIMSKIVTNDELLTKGYTLTDTTVDRPTVTEVSTLDAWADLAMELRSGPMTLPYVTCRMDNFNQSILGSVVNLRINDYLWPLGPSGEPGYQINARVIGYEIDPGEFGADDIVKLLFENPRDTDNIKRSPD
jgi:hypothetical protein